MENTKSFLKSQTIWAGIVQLIVAGFMLVSVVISEDQANMLLELVFGLINSFTGTTTIVGRVRAKTNISIKE